MGVVVRLNLVCISLIVISLMFAGTGYPDIDRNAVVAVWLFDEGSGDITVDSSGNGHDGTLENDPQWVDGMFGKALEFDGEMDGSHVSLPPEILTQPDNWSITLWAKTNSPGSWPALIQLNFDTPTGFATGIIIEGSTFRILYDDTCVVGGKPIVPGEWRHLAVTSSGNTEFKVYEDGVDVTVPAGGAGWHIDTNEIAFGYDTECFNGILDDIGVFNVTLEEEDIQDIMEHGLNGALRISPVEPSDKLATTWANIRVKY